jgi:hypothetical protein
MVFVRASIVYMLGEELERVKCTPLASLAGQLSPATIGVDLTVRSSLRISLLRAGSTLITLRGPEHKWLAPSRTTQHAALELHSYDSNHRARSHCKARCKLDLCGRSLLQRGTVQQRSWTHRANPAHPQAHGNDTTKLFKCSVFIDGCSCNYSNKDGVGVTGVCAHTSYTYQQRSADTQHSLGRV